MAPLGATWAKGAPGPPPASKTGVILRDQLTLAALGSEDVEFALFRTFRGISQKVLKSREFRTLPPNPENVSWSREIMPV